MLAAIVAKENLIIGMNPPVATRKPNKIQATVGQTATKKFRANTLHETGTKSG